MTKMVTFDTRKYAGLVKAYKDALAQDKEVFVFEGDEYLTTYAKYLIEYLGKRIWFDKTIVD